MVAREEKHARRGPVILVSNHLSFADHFFGPLPLPRKVVFLAKAEYFTGKGLKGLLQGVLQRCRDDPDGPDGGRGDRRSGPGRVLEDGNVLDLPGGHPLPDGRLYRGSTGIARLTLSRARPWCRSR